MHAHKTRRHSLLHARTHARTHTHTHAHNYTHTHARTQSHTETYKPTNTQTQTQAKTHARTHARTHAHTHTRTHAPAGRRISASFGSSRPRQFASAQRAPVIAAMRPLLRQCTRYCGIAALPLLRPQNAFVVAICGRVRGRDMNPALAAAFEAIPLLPQARAHTHTNTRARKHTDTQTHTHTHTHIHTIPRRDH